MVKIPKFIVLVITLALTLSMVGCSQADTPENNNEGVKTSGNDVVVVNDSTSDKIEAKPNSAPSDQIVAFISEAEELVKSVNQVDELRRLLFEYEFVTDVQVFRNDSDSQNAKLQITEGKVEKGTVVIVFYGENGESWIQYTRHKT